MTTLKQLAVETGPLSDPQHEAFCQEYARTRHIHKAARAAGLPPHRTSPTALNRLLRYPQIARRVQEIIGVAMESTGVTAERVMQELGRIAFADVRDLYDRDGRLLEPHELDDDTAATISGIDVETRYEGKGDAAVPATTKKIRRVDKMAALNVLAKHFKIVGEEGDGVNALASALADRLNKAKRRMNTDVEDAHIIKPAALPEPELDLDAAYPAAPFAPPEPVSVAPTPTPTPTLESDDELWK